MSSSSDEMPVGDDFDSTVRAHVVEFIYQKGKLGAAGYFNGLIRNQSSTKYLDKFLDTLLNPSKKIDDTDNIEWCKWLISGGRTPTEFSAIGKCHLQNFYIINIFCNIIMTLRCVLLLCVGREYTYLYIYMKKTRFPIF